MSSPLVTPQCQLYTLVWVTFKDNCVYLFWGVMVIRQANPSPYQSSHSVFKDSLLQAGLGKHTLHLLKVKHHFSSFTLNFSSSSKKRTIFFSTWAFLQALHIQGQDFCSLDLFVTLSPLLLHTAVNWKWGVILSKIPQPQHTYVVRITHIFAQRPISMFEEIFHEFSEGVVDLRYLNFQHSWSAIFEDWVLGTFASRNSRKPILPAIWVN